MNSGVLLICENNTFIGICSTGFGALEARAACRQMGYVDGVEDGVAIPVEVSQQMFSCEPYVAALTNGTCSQSMAICSSNLTMKIACHNRFISTLALDYSGAIQTVFEAPIGSPLLPIKFGENIPVGNNSYSEGVVHSQGMLSFGNEILKQSISSLVGTGPLPTSVIYPFLQQRAENVHIDARVQLLRNYSSSPHMMLLTRFIRANVEMASSFEVQLLVLIQWIFDSLFTVQSAVVTDFNSTYVIYTYECLPSYNTEAEIGIRILNGGQETFRYSSTPFTSQLACMNNVQNIVYYNLYYDLSKPDQFNIGRRNNQLALCAVEGYRVRPCCQPFDDPTQACRVQSDSGSCYCDALCFQRNDCCNDITDLVAETSIQACLPLCKEGTVNQLGDVVIPSGPVGVCDNGYIRFLDGEGESGDKWHDITCHQIEKQTAFISDQGGISALVGTFDMDIYPVYRSHVACSGLESRIQNCSFEDDFKITTNPDSLLNINCSNISMPQCTNGDVRLTQTDMIEGDSASQGLVEVCVTGQWMLVCEPIIHMAIEALLCQLANVETSLGQSSIFLAHADPTYEGVSQLMCTSESSSLYDCNFSVGSCNGQMVLALSCTEENLILSVSDQGEVLTKSELYGLITISIIFTLVIVIGILSAALISGRKKIHKFSDADFKVKEGNAGASLVNINTKNSDSRLSFMPLQRVGSAALLNKLSEELIVSSNEIRLLDCIGQGEFGLVYKAHLLKGSSPEYVAVKTLKGVFDNNEIEDLLRESLYMRKLNHPNVMQLLGICLHDGIEPYIVLPFMSGGSLLSYLKKNRSELLQSGEPNIDDEELEVKLLSMCLQIARGMEYIAGQNMIHRDLAARNCMIDHEGNIKVSDFGLSTGLYEKMYFRQEKMEGVKLPIKWMAIESIEDGIFSEKSDVWSFGVTCWEIFSGGKTPFGGILPVTIPKLLQEGQRLERPYNSACSQKTYKSLMLDCWTELPHSRPKFSDLVSSMDETLTSMAGYIDFNKLNASISVNNMKIQRMEETSNKLNENLS